MPKRVIRLAFLMRSSVPREPPVSVPYFRSNGEADAFLDWELFLCC